MPPQSTLGQLIRLRNARWHVWILRAQRRAKNFLWVSYAETLSVRRASYLETFTARKAP